jgi:NADH-quinone oxidoreductase subunit G
LDSRSDNYYVNSNDRRNYIFNSSLNGIEESDLIILVGANPRYEATILNARIRKSFLNNKTDLYSFGDIGDLTYPYKILDNKTDTIKDVFENKNELSEKIKNSKKPIIILGQSALRLKSGKFIFEEFKRFLISVNKINKDWNSLNILSNHASTVGSYDLNILSSKDGKNITLNQIKNNNFDILFLFGQDNLSLKKKNEFIIYVGSHGDKGAEMADVILPGTTYTEQDGYYINLEGKIQKAYKASYPPGDAKEDWEIINELSELLKRKKIYKNKEELIDRMMNYLKLDQKINNKDKIITEFFSEKIVIDHFDYYYSNVIARASKTMSECRNEKLKVKSTGTDG